MTKKLFFISFLLILLTSCGKNEMIRKTAVIVEDTPLYMDPDLTKEYSHGLKKNDLVNVVFEDGKDVYYILDSATALPFAEGYISGDKFTYDFTTANQAVVNADTVYKAKDESKPAGYLVEKGRTMCIIHGFEDDWASISLTGGIDGLWIKSEDLIYDLNYDELESENFGHYKLCKDYMEKEHSTTYNKYYANSFVRFLSGYDEEYNEDTGELTAEFVMCAMSKNDYKDPDTVDYIKEAKDKVIYDEEIVYYETMYREYNMYRTGNYILKLTATVNGDKLENVKLYSDVGVGADADWKELKKGLGDFIIE